jgi:choline dehydrogenase-like flavoprotein
VQVYLHTHTGLRYSDPFSAPNIDLNYYSDQEGADLRTLREGIRIGRSIMQQEPLASCISEVRVWV